MAPLLSLAVPLPDRGPCPGLQLYQSLQGWGQLANRPPFFPTAVPPPQPNPTPHITVQGRGRRGSQRGRFPGFGYSIGGGVVVRRDPFPLRTLPIV